MSPNASRRSVPRPRSAAVVPVLAALLVAVLAAAPAGAWEVRDTASRESFELFHERFASAAYHWPRHAAAPLGLTGFRLFADVSADRDFDEEGFYPDAVRGDLPGGTLAVARVGARKGLPGGIDLGLAYGRAVDGDVELVSADVGWAFLEGGVATPALALRLTGTRSVGGGPYDLEQVGAELMVSKGFPVVTPYAGAGLVWSDGTLARAGGGEISHDATREIYYAGLVLNLLLPRLTVEAEYGEAFQAAVKVGFGL